MTSDRSHLFPSSFVSRPTRRRACLRIANVSTLCLALLLALLPAALIGAPSAGAVETATDVFINEFHYDNTGADTGEFIEVAAPAGTDLSTWTLVLYNGNGGAPYNTINLAGTIADQQNGYGTLAFAATGLQNGGPDGIALVDGGNVVVQFLSYEGDFTAVGGPADGLTSTDVGVSEPGSTPIGSSLQLTGTGSVLTDFVWALPNPNTEAAPNLNQTFEDGGGPVLPDVFISELHYDNDGSDVGEFFEIEGAAGIDLAGYSVVLYNGNGGAPYDTINLAGVIPDEGGAGRGAIAFQPSSIQNGSPDGLALIDDQSMVLQFLSYEGTFTAVGGAADGELSEEIVDGDGLPLAESGSTQVGESLQFLFATGEWGGPAVESPDLLNTENSDPPDPPEILFIHEIQGAGDVSPIAEGTEVSIEGIVVGDFQAIQTNDPGDEPLDGFFVQEEDSDADNDPLTSEGIFVYYPANTVDVVVGNRVQVTGTLDEFFGMTEIDEVTDVTIIDQVAPLPTPAAPVLPLSSADETVNWEAVEGMSVSFSQRLYVTGMFPLGAFGEVQLSATGAQDHPNQLHVPGSPDAIARRALNENARVILDDGENESESFPNGIPTWNPTPTPYLGGPNNTLRSGDYVDGLQGVVLYAWSEYEVHPVNVADPLDPDGAVSFTYLDRPAAVPAVGGSLKVASFNVLNYFITLDQGGNLCGPPGFQNDCRGANTAQEFADQAAKIADAIADLDADIVGLVELENSGADEAIADLVAKVNANTGRSYDYVPTGFIGTDVITVGFIYDTLTVELSGDFAVLDSSVSPAFIDDKNRPVLAQTFRELATGGEVTASVSHLKSKGSPCDTVVNPGDPAFGVLPYSDDVDVGDADVFYTGNCNKTREAAAKVLAGWMAADPTGTGVANSLILGDLNAYAMETPITEIEALGWTNLVAQQNGFAWPSGHSYVFDGELGTLDYAMANPELLTQVTGAAVWNINADEPFAINYEDFNPPGQLTLDEWKSSDHDPVVIGLDLDSPISTPTCNGIEATIVGTESSDWIFGTAGPDVIVALGGSDFVFGFSGDDVICLGDGHDFVNAGSGDDAIIGGPGNDRIYGLRGDDKMDGGFGRDRLRGGFGNDLILGGPDNDALFGGKGDDTLDGGDGHDFGNGGRNVDTCTTIEWAVSCEL